MLPYQEVREDGRSCSNASELNGAKAAEAHCQLKQGWYPPAVGGAAVRCREVFGTPIGLPPLKRKGPRRSSWPEQKQTAVRQVTAAM